MKSVVLHIDEFETELGRVRTCVKDKNIVYISLPSGNVNYFRSFIEDEYPDSIIKPANSINKKAEKQIREFLKGNRKEFTLPINIHGTVFQKKVLQQVSLIPYGQTMSYGDVASAVGHPRAARAVGTVNAKNKLPFVIPCHRVVASNGIGGYGGGEELKQKLLIMENAI